MHSPSANGLHNPAPPIHISTHRLYVKYRALSSERQEVPSADNLRMFTQVGQSIQHEVEGFDPVTGVYVPTPCYFARPDWKGVMNKISLSHRGERVGVFVCGPSTLAGQLKGLCNLRNEQSRSDPNAAKYVFHKETF